MRGLPRAVLTDRRVRANLADASLSALLICPRHFAERLVYG